ncbi:MAG: hypothetical protein AB7P40_16465 [Chloroflexota bacterium]
MPQFIRFGCAGIAVILIAALTSVGLYAVVAGGLPFGGPTHRPVAGGAQVLVTIQASQATPTPPSAATSTPTPTALSAALAPPVALAAPAAPTPPPAGQPAPSAASTPISGPPPDWSPSGSPPAGGPPGSPAPTPPWPDAGPRAAHEGLTLELVEIERSWRPTDSAGAPLPVRSGSQLVTVLLRAASSASDPRYVAVSDVVLVAEDGSRFAPRTGGPVREPPFLTIPLIPGDTIRGWLTYEVPTSIRLLRLQWSPTRPDRPRAESTYVLDLPR